MTFGKNIGSGSKITTFLPVYPLVFLLSLLSSAGLQAQTPANKFQSSLREALISENYSLADSIILDNRKMVKPFVDGLVNEAIAQQLSGNEIEYEKIRNIANNAALSFNKIFSEKSLLIAVGYLDSWDPAEKKEELSADSINAVATALRGSDQREAIDHYKKALETYRKIDNERGVADVLGALGLCYYYLQDFDSALLFHSDALRYRIKVDDRQLIGNSLNTIGIIYLYFLPDHEKAVHYLDSACVVRTGIADMKGLGSSIHTEAYAFERMGHYDKAINYFRKSFEINKSAGDRERMAEAVFHIGDLMNSMGNYTGSLENYEKALQIYTELNSNPDICNVLTQTGFVYSNLGDYNTSVEKLTEALKLSREENDRSAEAGAYNNLGIVLQDAGRPEKAKDYYEQALKIFQEKQDNENIIGCLNNLGNICFDQKDYTGAAAYHGKGLELSREVSDQELESQCLLNLGNDLQCQGKLDESLGYYKNVRERARALNSPELAWKSIAGMAENYESRGEFEKAIELNDTALLFLDGIRNTIKGDMLRASFMAAERYAFEDIIGMLTDLHLKYPDRGYDIRAFHYSEQSKARAFLDLLSDPQAIAGGHPGNDVISLEDMQSMCPDKNTVFLVYSTGDSSSSMWVITANSHQLYRLPGQKKLREQVETMRVSMLDPKPEISDFFSGAGRLLYNELIMPAEPYLSRKSRLIIIPDGVLSYLPFQVLLTDDINVKNSVSYSSLPYLVMKYPVSYCQSGSILKKLLAERTANNKVRLENKRLVAFGDPVFSDPNSPDTDPGKNYSRLEYSGQEIEKIAGYFKPENTNLYLRENACEDNVKKTCNLAKYNYIHFATHGDIDEENPGLSSLVFTKNDNSPEDGYLHANEIYNLDLNADLVVLSACQTGLGKLVRGEGIVGLTRAFMYAGTPSVLVSLWSVSDLSTSMLMDSFYRNLVKSRLNKTDALRKAQLDLINNVKFSNPFYWAPFVLIGSWN